MIALSPKNAINNDIYVLSNYGDRLKQEVSSPKALNKPKLSVAQQVSKSVSNY